MANVDNAMDEQTTMSPNGNAGINLSPEFARIAEDVFNFTLSRDTESLKNGQHGGLVYLSEVVDTVGRVSYSDLKILEISLFERILIVDPEEFVIRSSNPKSPPVSSHAVETKSVIYLYDSYNLLKAKAQSEEIRKEIADQVEKIIMVNLLTALRQPELLDGQGAHSQLVIDYCKPPDSGLGTAYADTLLGAMLNLSSLPKIVDGMVEYFGKPLDDALSSLEGNLWTAMNELCEKIHHLLEKILRTSTELKYKVLLWLGGCLDANIARGRISATNSFFPLPAVNSVSDGFAINLTSVLLRLSLPFVKNQQLFLRIDPTYSALRVNSVDDMNRLGVHCRSLVGETCLQPREDDQTRPVASQPFSFITECFHMTHRAIDLSIRVLLEKTQQLSHEIGMFQQGMMGSSMAMELDRMEMAMSRYLCMKCALLEPTLLKLFGQFEVATAKWLVQVILDPNQGERENYAPSVQRNLSFPLSEESPPTLMCVPELVAESVCRFMKLAETYCPRTLEEGGSELLEPLLSILLVLMSSKKRARNPHLRAHLAQSLASFLPRDRDQPSLNPNPLGVFYRELLFQQHPHKNQMVPSLLNVFVSIEMTGEGVPFEQRFNYRRPMYSVMDYLWGLPVHRDVFKSVMLYYNIPIRKIHNSQRITLNWIFCVSIFRELAAEAEANMEEVTPPLFLRFLNLLMNDAVFLLDESLSVMAQIKTMQTARDNGDWESLPADEQTRNEEFFRQISMTARFDNILGRETIHTLEYMSSEIKTIFCHRTMVDRITAMLNYFLYNLVGPKKKNLKVKDRNNEFKFDPAAIVKDICRIYVNLGGDPEFCAAVSRDGRSYSPQLFTLAQDVLARIGGADLVSELDTVSVEVARLAALQQTDEELLAEAPEEFLDPIMSTLMTDPVILPSSKINIDRTTIARHLLSDQTDPFNRAPLNMNMVTPNTELKQRIEEWIAEKRNRSQSEDS
ncbi:unnamed protein product [Nesidiocoris tenuis]|uniref:Ubiquitin conjugation factor E4 A n=1 Tax=Nesidiocoris tenuis TaxID=355587 RepID=A0A6H5GGL7_9HEMI|nr:unnamed protein product [Nesidiocoris tenuis]